MINTDLKSTANCTLGWISYLHPKLTYSPAIMKELQSRLQTTIPFELKQAPIKLKGVSTTGLGIICSQDDSITPEYLLYSLIPSTKDKALYTASTHFVMFSPNPSISPKLLTQIISSHKNFIATIICYSIKVKVDSKNFLPFFQSLRQKTNVNNHPIIHSLNISSPRGLISIINRKDVYIFQKHIHDPTISKHLIESPQCLKKKQFK